MMSIECVVSMAHRLVKLNFEQQGRVSADGHMISARDGAPRLLSLQVRELFSLPSFTNLSPSDIHLPPAPRVAESVRRRSKPTANCFRHSCWQLDSSDRPARSTTATFCERATSAVSQGRLHWLHRPHAPHHRITALSHTLALPRVDSTRSPPYFGAPQLSLAPRV